MQNTDTKINIKQGGVHPLSLIINRAAEIFEKIGFVVADGPELETDWNVFEALNFPKDHPAREMQDTFWTDEKHLNLQTGKEENKVMRTHTSSVQVLTMTKWAKDNKQKFEKNEKVNPIAIIVPGKVFRNEATDATHEANFYQLEGLYLSENASVGEMKYVIETFLSELFERPTNVRMRSSFFPFVEPGAEVDMSCFKCGGSGCTKCKHSGYIELMGAGMVHPNVLENCGIDSKKYSGFAFGVGVDRLAMMLWGIEDIRYFYNGDMRLTSQF